MRIQVRLFKFLKLDSIDIELVAFSRFLHQPIQDVKRQLRSLETAHLILSKTSKPSIQIEVLKDISDESIQSIIQTLSIRQQVLSNHAESLKGRSGGVKTSVFLTSRVTTAFKRRLRRECTPYGQANQLALCI